MGMYTEMHLAIELKHNTPKRVIDTLKWMVSDHYYDFETPAHKLFECSRSRFMLYGGSYYFDSRSKPNLERDMDSWHLTFTSNIKNYENEWEKFIDWIGPHVETDGHMGHIRYEESDWPTLIMNTYHDGIRFFRCSKADQYVYKVSP